ncbi:unnamed protein product [Medioppia subpectinata]|uniref:Nuclear receptor domain-containing protein n=1 Tax=Medioppia subpectinata TaxID=1979941 RepID=A0A7R9PUI9_9ACAR|nr:unnamed protein product [Medioppia subpectinata]CAG2101262.1 unnamed protein product [Medioppia subpectinata]
MTRNYGAMNCESCKTFFKRHALKNEPLICASNGKCDINVMTRRYCYKCRLEKCFAVGMKTELIRKMNEQFIRQIIQFTKSLNGFNNICADDKYALMKHGGKDLMLIRSLKYYNKEITGFRIQKGPDQTFHLGLDIYEPMGLAPILKSYYEKFISIWNYDDHIIIDLLTAILLEQQLYIYLLQRYLLLKYRSESESQTRLQTLMESLNDMNTLNNIQGRNFGAITCKPCKTFFRRNGLKDQPMNCPLNGKCIINPLTRQMCKKCRLDKCFALGMKKELIRNSLMGFNNMCADDRLALVKYNTKDIISICTLKHYDKETECFVTPILRAIILFNPNQPNLMHRNSVRLEQQLS